MSGTRRSGPVRAGLARFTCRAVPAWSALRRVAGDDAYERYLAHHARFHAGSKPLSAREFYDAELVRRWNGVNRCC